MTYCSAVKQPSVASFSSVSVCVCVCLPVYVFCRVCVCTSSPEPPPGLIGTSREQVNRKLQRVRVVLKLDSQSGAR